MPQATSAARQRFIDGAIAATAWLTVTVGLALRLPVAVVATAAAAVPVVAFLVAGHVAGRGAIVGAMGVAIGSALVTRGGAGLPWGELALLGLLDVGAMAGATLAGGLPTAAEPAAEAAGAGQWMKIVVEYQGPADVAGMTIRPPASPRRDPERRRRDRLTVRPRQLVGTGT